MRNKKLPIPALSVLPECARVAQLEAELEGAYAARQTAVCHLLATNSIRTVADLTCLSRWQVESIRAAGLGKGSTRNQRRQKAKQEPTPQTT